MEEPKDTDASRKNRLPINKNKILFESKFTGSQTSRLASFKPPRDLSLSSSSSIKSLIKPPRKTYTPNIPIKREKGEKSFEIKIEKQTPKKKEKPRQGGRGRGKERELVQTAGTLFGQGIAAAPVKRTSGGYFGGGGGPGKLGDSFFHKPVLKSDAAFKVDEEHEKRMLQELLCDDFIDDPDEDTPDIHPVRLPMIASCKSFKEEEDYSNLEFPREQDNHLDNLNELSPNIKVKTEPPDEQKVCKNIKDIKIGKSLEESNEMSVSQILTQTHDLVFIKLPNCLPSHPPEVKEEQSTSTFSGRSSSYFTQSQNEISKNELSTLDTLPEGRIGTLRIYKSGKTELVLGEHKLLVSKGTRQGFLQDAVKIVTDTEKRQGDLAVLGHIQHRLICTPDFETILQGKAL